MTKVFKRLSMLITLGLLGLTFMFPQASHEIIALALLLSILERNL